MAERCGFFNATNSSNPDRVYDSSDFAAYFASFIGNGVFAKHSDQLRVAQQDSPDMSVQVLGGQAWINGWWYENTSTLNLDIDPADGTLDRIDIIVVQFDLTNRVIKTIVRKGSPSAGATAPELNRDDDLWELKLAEVDVSHGTVNITDGKITDTRSDTEVCGWVSGLINQMDTTELFNQLKEATQDAVDAMNEALDGSTEGELKAYKKSLRLENNINAGADLDTFTTPGNYSCSAENSASVTNKPEGVTGAFMLFVYEQQVGVTLQELFSLDSPHIFVRLIGGEWRLLEDNDAIDTRFGKLKSKMLWEGNWSSGNLTVDGISDYELFIFSVNIQGVFTGFPIYAYKAYIGADGVSEYKICGVGGASSYQTSAINSMGIFIAGLFIYAEGDVLTGDDRGSVAGLAGCIALNGNGSFARYGNATSITKIVGVKMVAP